jgi:redox-sensitive bicupin YhaK (pirin superfamily)
MLRKPAATPRKQPKQERSQATDVILTANTSIEHEVAADESVFLLAVKGSGFVGEQQDAIAANQATLFTPAGNNIQAKAGAEGLQYVLCISK